VANDRLRDALLRASLSVEDLAERMHVDRKTAERWVTQARIPYPKHRHTLSTLLGKSESYLWPDALDPDRAAEVSGSEVVHFYPHRAVVPPALWTQLLRDFTERFDLLVYVGLFLPEQNPGIDRLIAKKVRAGARVRLLFCDPDSPAVAHRSEEEGIGPDAIRAKIRNVLSFYRSLADVDGVEVRFHATTLYNSMYRFDSDVIVNQHVWGATAAHGPAFHIRQLAGGDLFDLYADSFDRIWDAAKPITWPEH
jgi:transcriptional regulator with XRE-family HTH domain